MNLTETFRLIRRTLLASLGAFFFLALADAAAKGEPVVALVILFLELVIGAVLIWGDYKLLMDSGAHFNPIAGLFMVAGDKPETGRGLLYAAFFSLINGALYYHMAEESLLFFVFLSFCVTLVLSFLAMLGIRNSTDDLQLRVGNVILFAVITYGIATALLLLDTYAKTLMQAHTIRVSFN